MWFSGVSYGGYGGLFSRQYYESNRNRYTKVQSYEYSLTDFIPLRLCMVVYHVSRSLNALMFDFNPYFLTVLLCALETKLKCMYAFQQLLVMTLC